MKKFAFRLDNILRYRRHMEDLKQKELNSVLARIVGETEILEAQVATRKVYADRLSGRLKGRITVSDIREHRIFIDSLSESIKSQREKISALNELAEKKRKELIDARNEVKKLKKLRERKFEEYNAEYHRTEFSEMDELAAVRPLNGEPGE